VLIPTHFPSAAVGISQIEIPASEPALAKLVEELATVALAQLDAENRYRLRAARGRPESGLALLDKLDRFRSATGAGEEEVICLPVKSSPARFECAKEDRRSRGLLRGSTR
jgi:hypothetical protein